MKVYFEAYGCAMNIGESRELEERMLSLGWEPASSADDADLVVLSTCVVVAKTERNMMKRLVALSSVQRLLVTGCLVTTCREKAHEIVPDAEFVAPGDLEFFRKSLRVVGPPVVVPERDACTIVPLASGCNGSCSYCITRIARGRLVSRPVDRVIRSVEAAVKTGPREVQLTAQDAAAYGRDIGTDLPSLVKDVCELPYDFRVRVGMMNPRSVMSISNRVADMYREPKLFKFLHLPVQSGSDRMLRLMDRGYGSLDFMKLVSMVRERAPDLSLSTDIIIGYPGESDEDHERNLDLIVKSRPDIVNVTKFSPRPGTKAAESEDRVRGDVVKERSRQVTKVRFEVALRVNRAWVGREARALATEHVKDGTTVLRTDEYRQVVVPGILQLGAHYTVSIDDATPTYLVGSWRR